MSPDPQPGPLPPCPPNPTAQLPLLAQSPGPVGNTHPPDPSRVIGDWKCEKRPRPWQVAVYRHTDFQCGGVLVHPQRVLTAAHCKRDDCSHNLMLLRLEQPTQLTAAVQVLALPTQEPALGTGSDKLMYPDGLPCVDLTLLSNDVCAKSSLEMVTEFLSCAGPLERFPPNLPLLLPRFLSPPAALPLVPPSTLVPPAP
uniref:Peptidase S1 domain-containing protein n=1 Tax=Equus asinus TaxID=9793 RepID=A0A9L0J856_EQUAS